MEDTGIRLTANDRFKSQSTQWTRVGLLVAAGLHFGLFVLVRPFEAAEMGSVVNEMDVISFPPDVRIPPPPEAIRRPAAPRVSTVDVSDEITIERTTFDQPSIGQLPPPSGDPEPSDRPSFIAFDTHPVMLNAAEVQRVLEREYPRTLKDAGIEGSVELWLYVTEDGTVGRFEIKTSSGNPLLDEAAGRVVPSMSFTPAKNRDKVTAVWVSQWITFQVNE